MSRSTAEAFDLICSFPLLEDIVLDSLRPKKDIDGWSAPLTSLKLTGTLDLRVGVPCSVMRRLLDLPGGLHFSRINTTVSDDDAELMADMISRCSDTLESLTIHHWSLCASPSASVANSTSLPLTDKNTPRLVFIDLSKTTNLEYLEFLWNGSTIRWIVTTLQSVRSKNLQDTTISRFCALLERIKGEVRREWEDLDWPLVHFWSTHSIRPQIICLATKGGRDLRDHVPSLLPELTRRGLIDLDERTATW